MVMELVKYDMDAVAIQGLKEKYLDIVILPDDKASYAMVMAGQKECREIRKTVDEWHKEKKADIIKAGKHYDSEKNRVYDALDPIESHLKAVRKAEDDRIAKLESERIARIQARIAFITQTAAVGYNDSAEVIQGKITAITEFVIDDTLEEFQMEAENAKKTALAGLTEALTKRVQFEKEEADQKAESERLKKIADEQEATMLAQEAAQKVIDEANAKIAAEQKKIQDEKDKIAREERAAIEKKEREEREAKIREESVKNARFESLMQIGFQYPFNDLGTMSDFAYSSMYEEHRKAYDEKKNEEFIAKLKADREEKEAREKKEAEEKIAKEKEEKERLEALKPDRDKIKGFARAISQLISLPPEIKDKDLKIAMDARLTAIAGQVTQLLKVAGN